MMILQILIRLLQNAIMYFTLLVYIKQHTNITPDIIQKTKPAFCLDHLRKTKLKDYTKSEYVAYRNHRTNRYSYGDRKTDIPEIQNQINCLYPKKLPYLDQ